MYQKVNINGSQIDKNVAKIKKRGKFKIQVELSSFLGKNCRIIFRYFQTSITGELAWEWSDIRKEFYLHKYLPEMPELNLKNENVRKELLVRKIHGAKRKWKKY